MSINELFSINNEVVILTGVSGQLGRQYAEALLEGGAQVVGIDITRSVYSDALELRYSDAFLFCQADITDRKILNQTLIQIQQKFGAPTALVNNAAIDSPPSSSVIENGPFESYPESSWDLIMGVNVKGVYLCCQVFGTAMAKTNKGSIVNIASIYGMVSPDQSLYQYRRDRGEVFYKPVAYSVSKSALYNLTRYLAVYWAKSGVRVNTLTLAGVYSNQEQAFLDAYCSRIPVGRMAQPKDFNGALIFLLSQASQYMTGSNLVIDGGWTAI